MIASNIICRGASRFLNTAYFQDVSISGTATLSSLSLSGNLSVTGTSTLSGHVSVGGYNNTSYGLSASSAIINNWIRTVGNTGWYNESHGGGWWMKDNDYVRSYNKPVLMDHNIYFGTAGDSGYYVKTTGAAKFASVAAPTATINNATISGDLTVNGVLQANDFIKNIVKAVGGQLYVSPTFQALSSTTVTCTAVTTTQLSLTLSDNAINGTDYAGATWYKDSKVMLSGTITANTTGHTEEIIFSSVPGVVTANMSNSNKLQIKLDYDGANTYFKTGTLTTSDVAVMMYQINIPSGSTNAGLHPIGIYIKAYGTDNKNSYIDIFGGTSNTPNARLGLLTGLSAMQNGTTPSGWGIATTNGFFDGTIVSSSGKIGAFTLSSDLRSGTWGTSGSVLVAGGYTPTTADAKSIGGSATTGNTWAFTAGNAFGVTTAGTLYANAAVVSGAITAGANSKIGPWNVTTTSIYKVSNTLGSTSSGAAYFGDLGLSVGNKFKVDANGVATLGLSTGYHATMDTDSFDVLNGSTMLATFGETATIGNMSARGVSIDTNGFKFNNGGEQNFFIGINSRSGDTITSATATVTEGSSQTTINNIKYYRAAAISSAQTVISVVGHLESAIENGEPIISNAEFENVNSWVVDGGYLWVEDGFDTYSSFEESITYAYVASNTSNLPYMVLGISAYDNNNIPGIISFVQGYKNKATGSFSTALGTSTVASGKGAFACGSGTKANGDWSFACGSNTIASELCSHSEGYNTTASGRYSHAEGESTIASGVFSHSEGYGTIASGVFSHSEGYGTTASGGDSHAEGDSTTASGEDSHSEGTGTTASGGSSHSEGHNTTASGYSSHSEGKNTIASGNYSHSEGDSTIASGWYSHSSGTQTTASGQSSYSEGWITTAIGTASHAAGQYTVALHDYQFVIGKYNKATVSGSGTDASPYTYTDVGDYPFIIGKGTANTTANRSNAFTVDWSGNVVASGSVLAKGATLTDTLTGTSATFSSTISAAGATLTGALTGTSATFSSTISAAGATFTGALSGTSATFSSTLTATSTITGGSFSTTGSVSCASLTTTGNITASGNITAPNLKHTISSASGSVTITSSNTIDNTPAKGASLTLNAGTYILIARGTFNSGSSSGNRNNQIAIYTGASPTNSTIINESMERIYAAGNAWGALTTSCIVQPTASTKYTVGLTSSIPSSSTCNTTLKAVKLYV